MGNADSPAVTALEVLYVHPSGHLNDLVVPAGALSCLNATSARKLGRYAFEVADEEIASARIVAIDVHWALALSGFERLVGHVRRLRPDVPIVVGGVTAGHYAEELLARYPIDYVLRGDSEIAFAAIVEALLAGRSGGGIPNVLGRGISPSPPKRMTSAEYDATDCITCDWFPTYASVTNWDAVAFGQGRTIGVARGCPLRCPECYGSYASTFGEGYLLRSGAGVARLLRRAQAGGARNVRLFVGKPAPRQLSALLRGIGEQGPYAFDGEVGFYLCRPPEPDDVARLEAAFPGRVTLSLTPPEEHHPAVPPARLAREKEAWRRVAGQVGRSPAVRLDIWSTRSSDVRRVQAEIAQPENDHVKTSYGAVWAVTRPVDGAKPPFDVVRDAVASTWTFYAARLLSPALAAILAPFKFLDELDGEPLAEPPPVEALRAFHALVAARWHRSRLPTLPGLRFVVLPVEAAMTSASPREGVHVSGSLAFARTEQLEVRGASLDLDEAVDHRGVTLRAAISGLPGGANALAFLPRPLNGAPADASWLCTLGATGGALVMRLPVRRASAAELAIHLRVQDARVFVLDVSGRHVARGVAHLGYFRPPLDAAGP
jgi:hypothetical protein